MFLILFPQILQTGKLVLFVKIQLMYVDAETSNTFKTGTTVLIQLKSSLSFLTIKDNFHKLSFKLNLTLSISLLNIKSFIK